jgi:hypothetical protein
VTFGARERKKRTFFQKIDVFFAKTPAAYSSEGDPQKVEKCRKSAKKGSKLRPREHTSRVKNGSKMRLRLIQQPEKSKNPKTRKMCIFGNPLIGEYAHLMA